MQSARKEMRSRVADREVEREEMQSMGRGETQLGGRDRERGIALWFFMFYVMWEDKGGEREREGGRRREKLWWNWRWRWRIGSGGKAREPRTPEWRGELQGKLCGVTQEEAGWFSLTPAASPNFQENWRILQSPLSGIWSIIFFFKKY